METAPGKELEALRAELISNDFEIGESKFPNTIYAVKKSGIFPNGLAKIAIGYWAGLEQFQMMGQFFKTPQEVISYLNS